MVRMIDRKAKSKRLRDTPEVWRHYAVLTVFVGLVVGMGVRVAYLTVSEREFLQKQGDARSVRAEEIPAMRGVIYDRQGKALAVSTPVFAVWTDPSRANLKDEQVKRLAQALKVDEQKLAQRIARQKSGQFAYLERRIDYAQAQAVKALEIEHIYLQPEYRRFYPAGETTAHVVGVTNIDDTGIEGSERAYDQQLRGVPGGKVVLKDRLGNTIRDLEYLGAPAYGQDAMLSIDLRLQYLAYKELKSAVVSHDAKSASIVMLDVKNAEVLALVNQPSYNPNNIKDHLGGMRNRAITDTYEPGSTVKPFTALAALESGRYQRSSSINTAPGYFRVGDKLIQDPINRGQITLDQAIQKSSQVAIAKVALDLDQEAVFDVLQRAGFGEYVGLGLGGESVGFLSAAQLRYPVVRTSMSFGYGLSATPLQLARAYLTLASYGEKRQVSILKRSHETGAQRVFDRRIVADVISMMELVTTAQGTAPGAAIPGFKVAGKTGTARIVGPDGYDDERHVAWFAGMVPVRDPRLVVVVLVNEPKAGLSGGGAVAAPVFARVAAQSLHLLGVAPDDNNSLHAQSENQAEKLLAGSQVLLKQAKYPTPSLGVSG